MFVCDWCTWDSTLYIVKLAFYMCSCCFVPLYGSNQLYLIHDIYYSTGNEPKKLLCVEACWFMYTCCHVCLAAESRSVKAINCWDGRRRVSIPMAHISWSGYTMYSIQREFITHTHIFIILISGKYLSVLSVCVGGFVHKYGCITVTIANHVMSNPLDWLKPLSMKQSDRCIQTLIF